MLLAMMLFLFGLVFFLGACVGSFINVLVMRTLLGEDFVWGRSRCDTCRRELEWYELVPLFSYVMLKGRCRTCHSEIDVMHPMVELLTASLFTWWLAIGFAFFELSARPLTVIQPLFWLVVGLLLLIIVIVDLRAWIIPDWTIFALSVLTLGYRLILIGLGVYNPRDLSMALLGAVVAMSFFLFLWLITKKKGMGFGDVKLVFALGLIVEWPNVFVSLFLAFISGAIVGIGLLVAKKARLGNAVPFGPFLVAGTVAALLWGDALLRWYIGLL